MMVNLTLKYLEQRADKEWAIGYDRQQLEHFSGELSKKASQFSRFRTPAKILLSEREPLSFLSSFLAAIVADRPLFLCNPDWGEREWQQVFELVRPDSAWEAGASIQNAIMIPTGGSSGKIRFAIHTWETLSASVLGFCRYFGEETVNSVCVLPLYHVSGLMQFLRSFLTGGKILILPYKNLKSGEKGEIDPNNFFISLVPTQLQFLLETDPVWLSNFKTVLLGGAPAWHSLLNAARKYNIRLAPTYGMTETASQVVTLKPEDFLKGNNSSGRVLPHARVTISDSGIIHIRADSLCLGYYPTLFKERENFQTDDLGFFDRDGYLNIVGRCSQKIVTGGENVFPTEVEAAISSTQLVVDVCVVGLPDLKWGEVVCAVYVPKRGVSSASIEAEIQNKLSKFKLPKYWVVLEKLPRDDRGKINYQKVATIAASSLKNVEIFP